jgi:glycosyltransferase involved in cell wall biosynthesis
MEKLISFGFNREKMVHLPYFIDSTRFKVVPQKGDYVIFAGRLSHEKGVDVLVEAMRHVRGLRCIVAGDGPERPRIEALARSLNLAIEFTGFLTRAQLFPLIGGARALVLPSLWYENQPVSVLEAYALGTPAIVSEIGALKELVEDGEEGYWFTPGNAVALAERINRLADDLACSCRMGLAGRRRVERDHRADEHLERLEAIYDSVMG